MAIDIFDVVKINNPIDEVVLNEELGYSTAFCDYGVLGHYDFINVLARCLHCSSNELNFVFFNFMDANEVEISSISTVEIKYNPIIKIQNQIKNIRHEYQSGTNGKLTSRYAIYDEKLDIIIVAEESVPLTKIFYKNSLYDILGNSLLAEYTFPKIRKKAIN